MSFNDSFAGYLLFEIMMRVLNNKIEKMKKGKEMRFAITTLNGDVIIKKVNLLGFTKVFNNMNNQ